MISLTIMMGGMPVDKMEKTEDGKSCPAPTQDPDGQQPKSWVLSDV